MQRRPQIQAADQAFGQVDCAVLGEKVLAVNTDKSENPSDCSPNMAAATEPLAIVGVKKV